MLAMVCIVLIIVPLGLSIQLVLEAMARGSIVWEYEESRKSGEEGDDAALLGTKSNPSPTRHRFANSNEDGDYDRNKTGNGYKLNDSQELLLVGERKIELVDLAEIFMGRKGKLAFVSFVRYLSPSCSLLVLTMSVSLVPQLIQLWMSLALHCYFFSCHGAKFSCF